MFPGAWGSQNFYSLGTWSVKLSALLLLASIFLYSLFTTCCSGARPPTFCSCLFQRSFNYEIDNLKHALAFLSFIVPRDVYFSFPRLCSSSILIIWKIFFTSISATLGRIQAVEFCLFSLIPPAPLPAMSDENNFCKVLTLFPAFQSSWS
jgi:hypothetical protein